MKMIKTERGVAIILAMIMLLVMSTMALTVAILANIDFKTMAIFKRGQEAFIAAEACVREGRRRFEIIGIETLFFELQALDDSTLLTTSSDLVIFTPLLSDDSTVADADDWIGPMCRSGPRMWDNVDGPAKLVEIPPPTKALGRPIKNTSLPSGGSGGASLVPISFNVVGKDSQDGDKTDTKSKINTGTEISVGYEIFIPGGATNVY